MRGSAPAGGVDLSQVSTEDLMKMRGGDAPKSLGRKALELVGTSPEVMLAAGSGMVGQVLGRGAAVGKALFGGKVGTQEGADEAQAFGGKIADALTYQPRGEPAQAVLSTIGTMMDKSKLAGLGPAEAMAMGSIPAGQVARQANQVRTAASQGARTVADMLPQAAPEMAGVGAAETAAETLRRTRAESLPVPVKLSKGEASRDFGQQRFERETAKEGSEAGKLLRQHAVDESQNIVKNMEWLMDDTGAVAPSARVTGTTVDNALRSRSEFLKGKYKDAYRRAEAAGETAALVDTTPLLNFINENAASKGTASILKVAEDEAVRLGGAQRTKDGVLFADKMSINDIEKMRKRIVRDGQSDATNAHYAGELNNVIDQMTEGQGGKLYSEARQLFKDHAAEFKNQGAIKKLLGTKPGTTDRAVAFEDVFDHAILRGSADDTAAIFRSLEAGGLQGKQAIAELKGATMKYLQDQASKNAARDINGNPVLSYAKLNNAVRELEMDGKLDLLFGKKGAQQIRDITETIADLNVAPPGAVNTSTTSSVLMEALGAALTGRLPTATVKAVGGIKQAAGDYTKLRKAREALAEPEAPAVRGQRSSGTVH